MQYTKPMIDLVYEIRRRVDAALKPSIKMANPEMLMELATHYQTTKDTITKALIKELLFLAGDEWQLLLEPAKPEAEKPQDIPRQIVKVYRGQVTLQDAGDLELPSVNHETGADASDSEAYNSFEPAPRSKTVRMYRGQPVY